MSPALRVYEKVGLQKTRLLNCFLSDGQPLKKKKGSLPIQLSLQKEPDWKTYQSFSETLPSWQNQTACLNRDFLNLKLVEAYHKTKTIGYVIFHADLARIDQIGVHPDYRKQGVGRNLVRAVQEMSFQKPINVLNIDDESSLGVFFKQLGFSIRFQQWEMMKELEV